MSAPSLLIAAAVIVVLAGLVAWERGGGGTRELALAATLAAAGAGARVLFAAVPNATALTAIVICAGVSLGARVGAVVGATAALVSNAFLGQGPWTPWQMLGWGLVGAAAALAGPLLRRHRLALIVFGGACGVGFDALMDVYQLAVFGPVFTWPAFLITWTRGLVPFDAAHAATTMLLLAVVGPALIRLLDRYARRLATELVPDWEGT